MKISGRKVLVSSILPLWSFLILKWCCLYNLLVEFGYFKPTQLISTQFFMAAHTIWSFRHVVGVSCIGPTSTSFSNFILMSVTFWNNKIKWKIFYAPFSPVSSFFTYDQFHFSHVMKKVKVSQIFQHATNLNRLSYTNPRPHLVTREHRV